MCRPMWSINVDTGFQTTWSRSNFINSVILNAVAKLKSPAYAKFHASCNSFALKILCTNSIKSLLYFFACSHSLSLVFFTLYKLEFVCVLRLFANIQPTNSNFWCHSWRGMGQFLPDSQWWIYLRRVNPLGWCHVFSWSTYLVWNYWIATYLAAPTPMESTIAFYPVRARRADVLANRHAAKRQPFLPNNHVQHLQRAIDLLWSTMWQSHLPLHRSVEYYLDELVVLKISIHHQWKRSLCTLWNVEWEKMEFTYFLDKSFSELTLYEIIFVVLFWTFQGPMYNSTCAEQVAFYSMLSPVSWLWFVNVDNVY